MWRGTQKEILRRAKKREMRGIYFDGIANYLDLNSIHATVQSGLYICMVKGRIRNKLIVWIARLLRFPMFLPYLKYSRDITKEANNG